MTSLIWLGDPKSFDVACVGGKAATLSRLTSLDLRVPDGFCLPVTIMQQAHPRALRQGIHMAVSAMMACQGLSDLAVAVRSSAVDEDGASASFAGQHETYLNIIGAEAILQAVGRCWESAYSERAVQYRRQHGLSAGHMRLAVLVQQMVAADVAAVIFSANPVTGNRDEIMINASWGLGESVVSGTVTPDTFLVRKADLTLTSRVIADKQRMTVLVPGGTREVDAPRFLRREAALSDEQVVETARLALMLETMLGHSVDVECAYARGELYLLQCRPITTLK